VCACACVPEYTKGLYFFPVYKQSDKLL